MLLLNFMEMLPFCCQKKMANIRKRGKFYGAQFRLPEQDGTTRLVSVSTKVADVNEARRFAQNAEQMALKAAAVDKTHGMEYCEILLQAIRDAGASRLTESKAREYLSQISEIARGRPLVSYTVRKWFAEYLQQKKPNLAAATFTAYEWAYENYVEFLGKRADSGIENVEHADVRAWRDAQKKSGLSDKRVNNLLKYISGPFSKAAKTGMIPINPVAATESLKVTDSVQRKPFTVEEINQIIANCPTHEWQIVLLLGVYCGMRLGDAARRRVSDFDVAAGTVTFVPEKKSKQGKEVILPLHPSLLTEINKALAQRGEDASEWLTPTLAKTQIGSRYGLSSQFIGIMEKAEVARGDSQEGKGRGRTRFARSFHSTRHTAATWLANNGVAEDLRMLLTDHESKEVARRYTHQSIEQLRTAVQSMPSISSAE